MLYRLYVAGIFRARMMPRRICYLIAVVIARVYFIFSRKDKQALRENLRVVLEKGTNPAVIDSHVIGVFRNFAKYLADFFRLSRLSRKYIRKHIEIKGLHYLDDCLSEGSGAILLTAHLGNWELGGAVIGVLGYPISALVLEHKDKRINDFFARRRFNNDVRGIPLGVKVKQCFKVLKSNEVLAIVGDKDYTGSNECAEFFGKKARLPKGAAVLSLKTGAPIILIFVVREKNNTYKIHLNEPIKYEPTGDYDGDVKTLMGRYLSGFEKYIREYPDQWYAFERIWKQKPVIQ